METLPAVMIGGYPHSGKSTLAYHLSQALRNRGVEHYLLRATPDGEGDWSYQAKAELVRSLRTKGAFTQTWVDCMCRDITARQLPFLVDVGGRPQPFQEVIFDCCTHAVLLSRDAKAHAFWSDLAQRYALIVVADLWSVADGEDEIEATLPVLRGTISGLDRETPRLGKIFYALADRLAGLFAYDQEELRRLHLAQAPAEIVVDMERLAKAVNADPLAWQPADIRNVLDYLPVATPLALYGRGPSWLYAAIARHAWPADLFQFDPRLRWVKSPHLIVAPPSAEAPLQATAFVHDDHVRLEFGLPDSYVDYDECVGLAVPLVPANRGLILSGKLPLWLWTALAIAYQDAPWLAVYQPQLSGGSCGKDQVIVVSSRTPGLLPGHLVTSPGEP